MLCGIISFFWIPNYPDANAKFLSEEEKQLIVDTLPKTQARAGAKTWDTAQVKALFKDPTFPTFTLIWVCHAIGGWGVGTVLPTVIYELGLTDTAVAQLMTMPAYAFGCSCLVLIGWLIRTKRLISWVAAIGRMCSISSAAERAQIDFATCSGIVRMRLLHRPHHGASTGRQVHIRHARFEL